MKAIISTFGTPRPQELAEVFEYTPEEQAIIIKDGELFYNYRHFLPSGVEAEFTLPDGLTVYFPSGCTLYIGKGQGDRLFILQKGRRYQPYLDFLQHLNLKGVKILSDIFYASRSELETLDNESKAIMATGRIGNGGYLFNQTDGGEYGTTGSKASLETRNKRSRSVKNNVLSGSKTRVRLIIVDGITDSLKATAVRIGMDPNGFRKWEKEGFTHQEIADQFRQFGIGKGNSLFPLKTGPKQLGRIRTPEERAKNSLAHKGRRASEDTKQKMRDAHKVKVLSGTRKDNPELICVDGITDSVHATSKRIGVQVNTFRRLIKKGLTPQDIADKKRLRPVIRKLGSLFDEGSLSGYVGVTKNGNRWCARIKNRYIGAYSTPEEAAIAYNISALELYGTDAYQNIIP